MRTEKLYEKDPYLERFEAKVLSCDIVEDGYKILLDKTAFFPEGGGQLSDTGSLNDVTVYDVRIENNEIYHYTKAPFSVGQKVSGIINFERRYNFMQNHTAEHIVSGLVFKKLGYDNIGFHLSETEVTFDFNGFFTADQLRKIELEANKRVWQNLKVQAFYPNNEQLKSISYRSKSGIEGEIRIVEIENTDICACCAPHVKSTGEIGMIKFLSTEKQHGGTRIFMKCGGFALGDYENKNRHIKAISALLSSKTDDVASAVDVLIKKTEQEKAKFKELADRFNNLMIKSFDKSKSALVCEYAEIKDLQSLADGLHKTYGGVRTAICRNQIGAAFVMCGGNEIELEFQKLKSQFTVKGGGRGNIRQGSIVADFKDIKKYFGV